MTLLESPTIKIKWLQYSITIPAVAYSLNITQFFKTITQPGKLIMVFATSADHRVMTFQNQDQFIVCGIGTILDEIMFGPKRYITDILFVDDEIHNQINWRSVLDSNQ